MVVNKEECLIQILKYLGIPTEKILISKEGNTIVVNGSKDVGSIRGLGTSIISLAKHHKCLQFGKNSEEEALVRQWIEYAVCYAVHTDVQQTCLQVMKELNSVLSSRAYFVGNAQTLADTLLYCILYNVMINLSYQEKEQYMHVSRWFSNIQQDAKLRQKNKIIPFSRVPIYT